MANALARVGGVRSAGESGGLVLVLEVAYSGPPNEVPAGSDLRPVDVFLNPTDQPASIRSKMSAAVVSDATANGYSVVASDIILPTFQKG